MLLLFEEEFEFFEVFGVILILVFGLLFWILLLDLLLLGFEDLFILLFIVFVFELLFDVFVLFFFLLLLVLVFLLLLFVSLLVILFFFNLFLFIFLEFVLVLYLVVINGIVLRDVSELKIKNFDFFINYFYIFFD